LPAIADRHHDRKKHRLQQRLMMRIGSSALVILDNAPDRVAALRQFVYRSRPRSWSGSRAAAMGTRLPLLRQLYAHPDPDVAAFAKADGARLRIEIDREREQETKDDKANDGRFE
jgi:hypothetical protein